MDENEGSEAVADDGFLVEEEKDDDHEDLNNDVNVDKNFLPSFRKNEEEEKAVELVSPRWERGSTAAVGEVKVEMADLKKNASSNVVNQETIQRPTVASAGVLGNAGNVGNSRNDNMVRQGTVSRNARGGEGTLLLVADLLWWTTDAEVELELSKYGAVKEFVFYDEKFNGKSKGYCHAEFYELAAARACKEGMNGHVFNGRACVVAYASSPYMVRLMGETLMNRNQQNAQSPPAPVNEQARWGPGNSNNGGDNNSSLGRGNQGRAGPQGMGSWGPVDPMRNRHGDIVRWGFMGNAGGGFGQGVGAGSSLIHPQTMMGQGFDPAYGWHMGRMGGYGGFPVGPTPSFSGMLPSYSPVGGVGWPGVTHYVNPAYSGRGIPMNSMGMMPHAGMEGPNMGMWSDPYMGRWAGDEHGYRAEESNYAAEPVSHHQYGEERRDRGAWQRDRSGSSDKRYIDNREPTYDRDIARDKNTCRDHDWEERRRQGDRDIGPERKREPGRHRNRGRSSRRKAKSRLSHKDESQSRSEDADSEKRERKPGRHRYRERSSRRRAKSRLSHKDDSQSRSKDADHEKRRGRSTD